MKTDKELKILAKQVYDGNVFLAETPEKVNIAFSMILIFAGEYTFPPDTVAFYEDMSKAGPRSINGYPFFTSCHYLTKIEWDTFIIYYNQYKEMIQNWE